MMTHPRTGRAFHICAGLAIGSAISLIFMEGAASLLLFGMQMSTGHRAWSIRYSLPDPLVGSVGIPDLSIKDAFGPGVSLRTDSRGFRGDEEIPFKSPKGKLRILCSGDSMTFGYGIGNDEAWPARLAAIDPRIDTVNMGYIGYGLDQMYLRYLRDGAAIGHDAHILALIPLDMSRVGRYVEWPPSRRPRLELRDGRLVVVNYPLRPASLTSRAIHRLIMLGRVYRLRILQLLRWLSAPARLEEDLPKVKDRTLRMIENLANIEKRKHATLIVVLLPYGGNRPDWAAEEAWSEFFGRELPRRGIRFYDLAADFQSLPLARVRTAHFRDGFYADHYTREGADLVAELMRRRLLSVPEIARTINQRPDRHSPP
jgi:hypothetical protein